jgi:hypothetical protein
LDFFKTQKLLPFNARLTIFQSFVQSHLNHCSLVWGFTCKSRIDTLFSKQKSRPRAVIPDIINYRYRDTEIPGHTKTSFKEYGILTVQGIIAKNALTLLYRINQHGDLLPQSVEDLVPDNVPSGEDNNVTSSDWLLKYDSTAYKNSIFYKGPLLYISKFHTDHVHINCIYQYLQIKYQIRINRTTEHGR